MLDNEISAELKLAVKINEMTYQLVPHDNHWRNIAEKGIQIVKGHIISMLYGADTKFYLKYLSSLGKLDDGWY